MKRGAYFIKINIVDDKNITMVKKLINGEIVKFDGYNYGIHFNDEVKRYVITDVKSGMKLTSVNYRSNVEEVLENFKEKLKTLHASEDYKKYIIELEEIEWKR